MSKWYTPENIKEYLEDLWVEIRHSPRRLKYWYREKFTRTTIKVETLHGGYWDKDHQMLHVNFQLLTDYVEKEVAHMADICLGEDRIPYAKTPREKGLAYLLWRDKPEPGSHRNVNDHYEEQKAREQKIVDLYLWWKDIRPARVDVYDTPEYKALGDFEPFIFTPSSIGSQMHQNTQDPRYKVWRDLMDEAEKLEEKWKEEDTEKLIELIKLRHHLWT